MQTTRFNYALARAHALPKTIRANGKMERGKLHGRGWNGSVQRERIRRVYFVALLIKSYLLSPVKL